MKRSSDVSVTGNGGAIDEAASKVLVKGALAEPQIDLRRHHLPALDGLRAVAVGAVILYHLGFGWAGGGYLGVDLFFVLSGFLITGLLIEERSTSGSISLRRFWARRARRLFPALLVMLGAVALYALVGGPGVVAGHSLQGDIIGTLFYFANWHFIATHNPYFAQFLEPSPLEHTWTLAIEEQFYIAWPLLLLGFARIGGRSWRRVAIAGTAALAVASMLDMAILAHGATDITRVYFGTDSRAFELMVGALLAFWAEASQRSTRSGARALHTFGVVAACALIVGFGVLGGPPSWMFDGGFVAVSILAAVVIATVTRVNPGPLGSFLSLRPIRWVGRISYGLYLWHWPVIVVLTSSSTGMAGWAVDLSRVALMFALAITSFYLLEQPIRQRGFNGLRGTFTLGPLGVAVVAIALALGPLPATAGGVVDAPPPSAPAGGLLFALARQATPARPLRVLFIGDSLMTFAAPGLQAAFESTGVIRTETIAFPGWGLTVTTIPWRKQLSAAIAKYKPDVVMGTWSWDRVAAATNPAAYTKLLDKALGVILAPGDGVQGMIFLQFPLVDPDPDTLASGVSINHDMTIWNGIAASEAARHRNSVGYLPVAGSLELNGQFAWWLPDARGYWVRVRSADGVHLCPAGTARYAAATLSDLTGPWQLPVPAKAWWSHLHGQLGGVCPNDHPPDR